MTYEEFVKENRKQAVSFDLWNTLITPNKDFNKNRVAALSGVLKIEPNSVMRAIQSSKKDLDFFQESKGVAFDSVTCWEFMLSKLGAPSSLAVECLGVSNWMFQQYPPEVPENLWQCLAQLGQFFHLSIISNTNFVPGETILEVVFAKNISLFSVAVFSDQTLVAKPSSEMFDKGKPMSVRHYDRRMHVGDNIVTDGACQNLGIDFIKVKNPEDTLDKLKAMLQDLDK